MVILLRYTSTVSSISVNSEVLIRFASASLPSMKGENFSVPARSRRRFTHSRPSPVEYLLSISSSILSASGLDSAISDPSFSSDLATIVTLS